MATMRSSETLFIILATQQLVWASVTMEFSEAQRQRESGTAASIGIWGDACAVRLTGTRKMCYKQVGDVISAFLMLPWDMAEIQE